MNSIISHLNKRCGPTGIVGGDHWIQGHQLACHVLRELIADKPLNFYKKCYVVTKTKALANYYHRNLCGISIIKSPSELDLPSPAEIQSEDICGICIVEIKTKKSQDICDLLMNARHYRYIVIAVAQNYTYINPSIRYCFDFVLIYPSANLVINKKMHYQYFYDFKLEECLKFIKIASNYNAWLLKEQINTYNVLYAPEFIFQNKHDENYYNNMTCENIVSALPIEILDTIIWYLSPKDIVNVSLCCRHFANIVRENKLYLEYHAVWNDKTIFLWQDKLSKTEIMLYKALKMNSHCVIANILTNCAFDPIVLDLFGEIIKNSPPIEY